MKRHLWWVWLALACGGRVSETLAPTAVDVTTASTPLLLSAAPSFADERGGGIFVDLAGQVVRVRANGARGAIDVHPQDPVYPGPAASVWPLGPYSALVSTNKGLFVADNGWLIAPQWQSTLESSGLVATAVGDDSVGWVAHAKGLFRLEGGQLSELKVDGATVTGLTALAVGPAPDARAGVWFAQGTTLTSAAQTTTSNFIVRDSGLSAEELAGGVLAMAGISRSSTSSGEVWAITPKSLFRFTVLGWQRYELGRAPHQLMSAGRFAWLQAGDGLYRYDADAQKWLEAKGLAAVPTLLAVDAAGSAWVRVGEQTLSVSPTLAPRLSGLFERATIYAAEVLVEASLPVAASAVTALEWSMDDGDPHSLSLSTGIAGTGPQAGSTSWSLGGADGAGNSKPVSLSGLSDGAHALQVSATLANGSTSKRRLYFEFLGSANATISYDRDVRPISEARCAKCHATGTVPELKTYQQWKDNAASLATAMREKRMPADGPLDPAGIQLVQRWVNGGALP
jgi:hypothetical protein